MTKKIDFLISTDLDGTLLNYNDFSFEQIIPFIKRIIKKNVLIIVNTSKTASEVIEFLNIINHPLPFIVESGSAIYYPKQKFTSKKISLNNFDIIYSSKSTTQIEKILKNKKLLKFKNLYKLTKEIDDKTLSEFSGLKIRELANLKKRSYSHLMIWNSSQKNLRKFKIELEAEGMTLLKGARFLHLKSKGDKGLALLNFIDYLKNNKIEFHRSISLGDSVNDLPMLSITDYSCIIKLPNDYFLNFKGESVIRSKKVAPLGWKEALMQVKPFFNHLNK